MTFEAPEQRIAVPSKPRELCLADYRVEAWRIFSLAWPLALAGLGSVILGLTDIIFLGQLGTEKLAGGALGNSFQFPFFLFILGVLAATTPIIAQALGGADDRTVRRCFRQSLWVAAAFGLPASLLLWYGRPILLAFGQEPEIAAYAEDYLRAAVWGFAPALWYVSLRFFVSAHGQTWMVLVVNLVGVVLNIIGDYAFIFGHFGAPRMEVAGAGLTTALVNIFFFVAMLVFILCRHSYRRHRLLQNFHRPDWRLFGEIVTLGLPIGFTIIAESGLFTAATLIMGYLGTLPLAAHAIAFQVSSLVFMVPLAIAQAATIRTGLAIGGKRLEAAHCTARMSLLMGWGFVIFLALFLWFLAEPIAGLFLEEGAADRAAVTALAASLLLWVACYQLGDGTQIIAAGILRGFKDTKLPLVIVLVGCWAIGFLGAAVSALLLDLGPHGVWAGLTAGLWVTGVLMLLRVRNFLDRPFVQAPASAAEELP
jgi:MATE family multidrug resistance protein